MQRVRDGGGVTTSHLVCILIGVALSFLVVSATIAVFKLGRSDACAHPHVCDAQAP